jgi:anti-sigma-K factor RskA
LTNGRHIPEEDLRLLAAGAMPEEECAALRAHAAECPECAAKLAEERGLAALLGLTAPQEKLSETIKAELFARIRTECDTEERNRWPVPEVAKKPDASSVARRAWWNWVLAPMAAALLVAAGVEWQVSRRLGKELASVNHQLAVVMNERQRTEMMLDVLAAQDTMSVKMAGTPGTEMATGMVRYNPRKGMVMYTAELPPPPRGKIYQMWLVPATGVPISAGIFVPVEHGTRQMWMAEVPLNTEAKLFAVTVEPGGGMPQPTGVKVLVGVVGG